MRNIKVIAAILLLAAPAADLLAAPRSRERRPSPLSVSQHQVRRTPSAATREAFREFVKREGGKGWKVRYNPRTALPEAVTGGRTKRYTGTPEQAALAFFEENKALLKVEPSSLSLALKREFMGVTHLQYQQYKDGIPVEFSYARVHVAENGAVSGYQGRFEPEIDVNTFPLVPEQAAVAAAAGAAGRPVTLRRAELVIYPDEAEGRLKLAWKVRLRGGGLWVYYIDASDGSVLYKYDDLRYVCAFNVSNTTGTSTGMVYPISPIPDYASNAPASDSLNITEDNWAALSRVSLRDQYVWVGSYSSMTATDSQGRYCAEQNGKVFSSFKGPFFSVTNFRGASAHFDNGSGVWLQRANSFAASGSDEAGKPVTIADAEWNTSYPSGTFAKAMPRFTAFDAGTLDAYGNVGDADLVTVKNGSQVVGSYIGRRTSPFFGASVESPSYTVHLHSDGQGSAGSYAVDISSFLILTNNPGARSNATGSPHWSTATAGMYWDTSFGGTNAMAEVNAFYHLNSIRRYFDPLNVNTAGGMAVNLSGQVPVMVHASGDPDSLVGCVTNCRSMMNAYYDLEKNHIVMGDGMMDYHGKYRSFALDGTIVRHEYIHLVIDKIYPIVNFGEFGAISEAVSDYFALASFWKEGHDTQVTLGNFVGAGEGAARDISGSGKPQGVRKMPASASDIYEWYGEVHEDSLILAQALHRLRPSTAAASATDLGVFTAGTFSGLSRADALVFASLFYFPDTFNNFYEAMLDACDQFETKWPGQCTAGNHRAKITSAFSTHNIGAVPGGLDAYETGTATGLCNNNNGPECASDISSLGSLSATVFPVGDVDYYSLPLSPGDFKADLSLPMTSEDGVYSAYGMFLFDSNREYVTEASPTIFGTGSDACPDTGQCRTLQNKVSLSYTVPFGGGRYYLVVSGAANQYYGNSETNSATPYTLTLTRTPQGSATARIYTPSYDNDEFSFDSPFPYFEAVGSPSSGTLTLAAGAELVFQYAQLRDHNFSPIALSRTDQAGSYMTVSLLPTNTNTDSLGRRLLSGRVKILPGFSARYPGVGTVYLETFGRNHMGQVISLGVSNAIHLTANRSEVTAYNNIIGSGGSAIIKYETLSPGSLSVKVYTVAGALVRTVYDGPVEAGRGSLEWDGTNSSGGKAATGIYFVKTKGPGIDKVVKVAVIR